MKFVLVIVLSSLLLGSSAAAQTVPFEMLRRAVNAERGGFAGNKENLSRIFNDERIRLAGSFESELWKYLGDDIEKHYWIGSFLEAPSYLHGNTALPSLSLTIWQRGLNIRTKETGDDALGMRYPMLVLASVQAQKLGKADLASTFKAESTKLGEGREDIGGFFPAISEFDRCIYREIGGDISRCGEEKVVPPKETIVQRGHIPTPEGGDPRNFRVRVKVHVTIDETGHVIAAEPIEGSEEYHERALDRARKATFAPLKLSGKAVKVQGVLTYYFK